MTRNEETCRKNSAYRPFCNAHHSGTFGSLPGQTPPKGPCSPGFCVSLRLVRALPQKIAAGPARPSLLDVPGRMLSAPFLSCHRGSARCYDTRPSPRAHPRPFPPTNPHRLRSGPLPTAAQAHSRPPPDHRPAPLSIVASPPPPEVRYGFPVGTARGRTPGRLAQRESASFTPKRSLVRSQYRPPDSRRSEAGSPPRRPAFAVSGPSLDRGTGRHPPRRTVTTPSPRSRRSGMFN